VAVAGIVYATGLVSYFVMPDELGYAKQAGHIARTGLLNVPGDMFFASYGQLEPLLIAPAYALFATPTAFDVAHAINAVAFASTAIPVYLLARRVLESPAGSLLAAALSVAVPWLAMAGTVLTEPAAYPAFSWALFAMLNALEKRTWQTDLVALAGLALAFFSRTQFVVLIPAFLVALVVHRAWDHRGGVRVVVREHIVLLSALAAAIVLFAADRGALLSNYTVTASGTLFPAGWLRAARELTAYVAVAVGVLPLGLAGAWTAVTLVRPAAVAQHAFAALSLVVGLTLIVLAGTYTVRFSPAINDRYLLYLVPILAVGAVAALLDPRRASVTIAVGGMAAAVLVGISDLVEAGPTLISPSAAWHSVINGRTQQLDKALGLPGLTPPTAIAVAAGAASVAIALARQRMTRPVFAALVGGALLVYGAVETGYTLHSVRATQAGASADFTAGRNWVDQIVGRHANVTALLGPAGDPRTSAAEWWDTSFFNESITRVYAQDGQIYDQSFARAFTVDPATGTAPGLTTHRLAVAAVGDRRVRWREQHVLAVRGGLQLIRLPTRPRAAWSANPADPSGVTPPKQHTTIRLYGDGGGARGMVKVSATVAAGATTPAPFSVTSAGRLRRASAPADGRPRSVTFRLPMPARGFIELQLRATGPAPVTLHDVGFTR
jgi:hypothetical protein